MINEDQLAADLQAAFAPMFEPLTFQWHSTGTEGDRAVILFDGSDGYTYAVSIPREIREGSPATLSRVS